MKKTELKPAVGYFALLCKNYPNPDEQQKANLEEAANKLGYTIVKFFVEGYTKPVEEVEKVNPRFWTAWDIMLWEHDVLQYEAVIHDYHGTINSNTELRQLNLEILFERNGNPVALYLDDVEDETNKKEIVLEFRAGKEKILE